MANTGDDYGYRGGADMPRPVTGPEQWLGGPDPIQSFGNTIEQALQRLTIELAGLRAERDGLRLELEGLRTQLQLTQQQLTDRERFAATVRELGHIVQQLSAPPRWGGDPVAAAAGAQATAPPPPGYAAAPPVYAPPPIYQPPEPPAPVFTPPAEPPPPSPPPAPESPVFAPPTPQPEAYVPPAPEPAPTPEPPVAPEPAPEVAYVAPEPEPIPMPAPPPAAEPEPDATGPRSYSFTSTDIPESRTSIVASPEESFFSGPGIWIGEPVKAEERRGRLKTWATRIGSAFAVLIVAVVFLVSIGPKFLPYQTFFVRSGSMHPTFDTGDMILLGKVDASDLKVGDVITFDRPDKPGTLVTHRIVQVVADANGKQFVTKGDANGTEDPWRVPAQGTGWKYQTRLPKLGYVFGYLGTPQARLALLAIPATLLGLLSIIDIWKPQPKASGRR
jgi:signal peptidase